MTTQPDWAAKLMDKFGPPPIMLGEDCNLYRDIVNALGSDLKPATTIEEMALRELADQYWIKLRYRNATRLVLNAELRAMILRALICSGVKLKGRSLEETALQLQYAHCQLEDPRASEILDATFAATGQDMSSLEGQVMTDTLPVVREFEKEAIRAQAQFDKIVIFWPKYRGMTGQTIDGECDEVPKLLSDKTV